MNTTAYSGAISRDKQASNYRLLGVCLGMSLILSLIAGNSPSLREWRGLLAQTAAPGDEASQFPGPPAFSPGSFEIAAPVESQDDEKGPAVHLLPLRGAPTWVWDLPNDDPRKIAAGQDWDVVAHTNRESGMAVMEWAGKIIPDSEYWNGLCPRWTNDPEWGGVGP